MFQWRHGQISCKKICQNCTKARIWSKSPCIIYRDVTGYQNCNLSAGNTNWLSTLLTGWTIIKKELFRKSACTFTNHISVICPEKKIYIWFFGTFLSFVTFVCAVLFIPITFIMSIVIKLHQVYWILTVQRHSTYHHKDVRAMIIFQMMHQCVMQIYTLVSMQYFGFLFFQVACLQHDNQLITFGVVAGLTG